MAIYVSDIINRALGILGVYTGDPLSAGDANTAMFVLNMVIDGWGAEDYTIYNRVSQQFATVGGKNSYKVGLSAASPDFVWTATPNLPSEFDNITWWTSQSTNGVPAEFTINFLTSDQWANTSIKGVETNVPSGVFPIYGTPTANNLAFYHTLKYYPTPNTPYNTTIYANVQIPQFTAIANIVQLRPGYLEALILETAIKASSEFGRAIPEWVLPAWELAKERIKAKNFEPLDSPCEVAYINGGMGDFGGGIAIYKILSGM